MLIEWMEVEFEALEEVGPQLQATCGVRLLAKVPALDDRV
jgi:hypothetical protein